MHKEEKTNPLSASVKKGNYSIYLKDLCRIFYLVKKQMKKNSVVVIEISNLKGKEVTTLAWDVAKEVSKVFEFEGEIVICWKGKDRIHNGNYGYGYDHSYCLIFGK